MCRLGPEGYGSISSWYQWFSGAPAPGPGFSTRQARASSQTRCHLASIACASYRSIETKKPLRTRGRGKPSRRAPRVLPELDKQLLHRSIDTSNVLELFPLTARIDAGELILGGVAAGRLAEEHG